MNLLGGPGGPGTEGRAVAKPRAYVETTIVSYLTAWPSKDPIVAGHQVATRAWWATCGERYELVTSITVLEESQGGDPAMAQARLAILATIPLVPVSDAAVQLADELIRAGIVPGKARPDAVHVAAAVTNGVEYLVTWNCKHLANAALRKRIDACCIAAGFSPVIICTPDDLPED
jgi:hypothetical protein